MDQSRLLEIIRTILAQPAAPFYEDAVRSEILQLLAQFAHVRSKIDAFGNVIAHYQRGDHPARFAFAAHMDHPGYVQRREGDELKDDQSADRDRDGWTFLGGVPKDYLVKEPPIRDFGAFAMWDLPAFELREERIYSRACDDLIGCAAIVAMFQVLEESEAETSAYGLFTRAEEVGFVGAIHLAKSGELPKEVTVISLETSSEKGGPAAMGAGAIIRVGDRTSVFDSDATGELVEIAKADQIPYQRLLMSGGTCEATAYQLYGYRSAALCVALGNYHNCGPDQVIAPEYVSIKDVEGLVALCAGACRSHRTGSQNSLREKLEKEIERTRRYW